MRTSNRVGLMHHKHMVQHKMHPFNTLKAFDTTTEFSPWAEERLWCWTVSEKWGHYYPVQPSLIRPIFFPNQIDQTQMIKIGLDMIIWHSLRCCREGFLRSIQLILRGKPGALTTAGPPSGSFVFLNMFTSGRTRWRPLGDRLAYVQNANKNLVSISRWVWVQWWVVPI